jgi:hypothetical protein
MKGWTVLFFIYVEDEDTSQYATELLQELLRINHSEHLNLLLFESIYDFKNKKGTSCKLYNIESSPSRIKRRKVELTSFDHMNPGDTKLLEVTLQYIKEKKLIRDRFLLFTWDHGAGFGIFNNDPRPREVELTEAAKKMSFAAKTPAKVKEKMKEDPSLIKRKKVLQVVTNARGAMMKFKQMEKHIKGTSGKKSFTAAIAAAAEEPVADMLTATEINNSLQNAGVKADLMIMMNCWTQMLETGSELSSNVDILVAPETVYYFEGYDYFIILNSIVRNPDILPEELATVTVDSIEAFFDEDPDWAQCTERIVVSAVRPPEADAMIQAIDKFFAPALKFTGAKYDSLRKCRQRCLDLSKNYFYKDGEIDNTYLQYFIDLLNFAAELTKAKLVSMASWRQLQSAWKKYVLHLYRGKEFLDKNAATGTFSGNGLSIFHPDRLMPDFDGQLYYRYFYKNQFLKISRTTWGEYLAAYREQQV